MKDKYLPNFVIGVLMALLFQVCAAGSLVTGWELHLRNPELLWIWGSVFALFIPVLLYFRHGIWVLLLLTVRGAFALWQEGELWRQIRTLAYVISSHYRDVYSWPVIGDAQSESFDLVMILLAYLTALCVSICICRNKSLELALIPVLIPLFLCLVTTDRLPAEWVLALLIFGIVLLLLTDWVRRNRPERFAGLFFRMLIPSAAALMLLFGLNPQEGYINRAADLQRMALNVYEKMKSAVESAVSGNLTGNSGLETVNLMTVGPKSDFTYTTMRITSPWDGVVYLRGHDYDIYTGTSWESSEDRSEVFTKGTDANGQTMKVVTYGVRSVRYVPYYSTEAAALNNGYVENNGNSISYSYSVSQDPAENSGSGFRLSDYDDLPRETELWARKLAKEILGGKTTAGDREKAKTIGDYVRASASYDLQTPAMGADETDFARWFLETSDTGYCVHFATASAVLLRAAGVSARYVEGYMAPCLAYEKTLVTNQAAHAWVEYYDSDDGVWRILESTPADALVPTESVADEEPDETEETEAAGETEPEETEETSGTNETDNETPAADDPSETFSRNETDEWKSPSPGTDSGGNGGTSGGTSNGTSGGDSAGTAPPEKKPFVMPDWVKKLGRILLTGLLTAAAVTGQAYLRIRYRYWKWYRGTPNEMALERRRQLERMARRVGLNLPDELEELALKAKFSQHILTREELYRFERFRKQIQDTVSTQPWYRRLYLFLIHAIM